MKLTVTIDAGDYPTDRLLLNKMLLKSMSEITHYVISGGTGCGKLKQDIGNVPYMGNLSYDLIINVEETKVPVYLPESEVGEIKMDKQALSLAKQVLKEMEISENDQKYAQKQYDLRYGIYQLLKKVK